MAQSLEKCWVAALEGEGTVAVVDEEAAAEDELGIE
jgi:hypothetical protein